MSITYPIIKFLFAGGEILTFSNQEITRASLLEEINSISVELSINTLDFELIASDDSFSMFSGSTYTMLEERLPMLAYESVDGEQRLLGKFYLKTWKNTSERKMEFTATDIVGVMEDTPFDGLFFSGAITLTDALAQVLNPINVLYDLDTSLADVEISGWIPPGNYRDALRQVCFAGGAIVDTARRENVSITPVNLPVALYDYRIKDSTKRNLSIELLPLVSSIELVSHNYTQGLVVETIFDKYLEIGSYKIIFEKPYYDVIIVGPGYVQTVLGTEGGDYMATENGDYIEAGGEFVFGPNSVYLTISVAGTVTITGYPWIDSKQLFIFTETGVIDATNKNKLLIENATLVSVNNAQTILDQARDYYRQRYAQKIKLLPSRIKVSDIVLSNTLYSNRILASVQKMNVDLFAGYLAETDIRGIIPVYILPEANPTRRARTGLAISGAGMTRNNKWRQYA